MSFNSSSSPSYAAGTKGSAARSIGTKLAAGLTVLSLLSVVVGGFAINRMMALHRHMAAITDNYLVSAQKVGAMGQAVARFRAVESETLMTASSDTAAVQVESRRHLEQAAEAVTAARAVYDPLIDAGAERDRFTNEFDRIWPELRDSASHTIELAQKNSFNDALAAFKAEASRDVAPLDAFIAWDMQYQTNVGQAAGARAAAVSAAAFWIILGCILASIVAAALLSFGLIRHIARPIATMTGTMRRLAGREMNVQVPYLERGDEVGAMAQALQVFKDNMAAADRLAAEQEAERIGKQRRTERLETLVHDFERQIGGTVSMLASASTEMEATARAMSGSAERTDAQAGTVARAAEESSVGVQTVASASEELASSIGEINRQVSTSAALAAKVVDNVRQTDRTVRTLAESAARIGQVVELIDTIAGQTNLLALNATIEAARAGEAGKGFAVVASEVKSLAQQTGKATSEIGTQIGAVQKATQDAVDAIRDVAAQIEEIGSVTTSIAAAVEEQGAATAEIARNVQQTAASTQVVTTNIGGVSQAANDTGAAASQVLSAAGDLSRQAEGLSGVVNNFIAAIRVA